jgi:hypothetical protein
MMVYPRQVVLDNVKRLQAFDYPLVVTGFTQLVTSLDEID